MTFALLPAGGLSTRMGRPKLSLPLGGRTVLEQVIRTLRRAAVEHILVVLGPHAADLAAPAANAGALVEVLAAPTPDMRATVVHGLRWLEQRFHPQPEDFWLLIPADHPALAASVVQALQESRRQRPERSIFIPTFNGQRGHPALLAWQHVAAIHALPRDQGLNRYFRLQQSATQEVPVDSPAVLTDLDTPEDYERLLRDWREM